MRVHPRTRVRQIRVNKKGAWITSTAFVWLCVCVCVCVCVRERECVCVCVRVCVHVSVCLSVCLCVYVSLCGESSVSRGAPTECVLLLKLVSESCVVFCKWVGAERMENIREFKMM